jgi:hypothetical protein
MAEYVVEEPSDRSASWRVHERIVRCRDCYHCSDVEPLYCRVWHHWVWRGDGFCSRAEPRTGR